MRWIESRALSILAVCGYGVYCLVVEKMPPEQWPGFVLFLGPLALIWFAKSLGDITGIYVGHTGHIDYPTPSWMIAAMGWVFMIVIGAVIRVSG